MFTMTSRLSKSADNFHMRQNEGEEGMFTFVCCQVWKYNVTLKIVPFAWSPPQHLSEQPTSPDVQTKCLRRHYLQEKACIHH